MTRVMQIQNWLRPIAASLFFCAAAGMSNAAMDVVSFRYPTSIFAAQNQPNYYNPQLSWKNKWALDARGEPVPGVERFWGSSTLWVMVTDMWHLAKAAMLFFVVLAIVTYRRTVARPIERIADMALCYSAFTGMFSLCFTRLFIV